MRKLFTIVLVLVCVLSSQSQTQYHIYKVVSGPKNIYTNEYNTQEHSVGIGMIFDNSVIRIFDEARSVYIVRNYREIQNDYRTMIGKWDGVDEKSRSVGVFMTFNKQTKEQFVTIAYNDFIFQYYFYE
jgi:hypothetical protein